MTVTSITIAHRFHGPPRSGNGGYTCGRVAAFIDGAASVRLKAPPPLDRNLQLIRDADAVRLFDGDVVIAEGRPASLGDLAPPAPPAYAAAVEASTRFVGFERHAFPSCFVCGPEREAGDGLRIFPGPMGDDHAVAGPWVPDASLASAGHVENVFLWSALDCTSAYPVLPVPDGKALVLGELAARIDGVVAPGEKCIATAWALGVDGRKRHAGSAVCTEAGRIIAVGRATWIEVKASAFGGR